MDRKIIQAIVEHYQGGPVGIDTLATSVGEESGTIEELHEPFLIQSGFIKRTKQGRVATKSAFEHLGKSPSGSSRSLIESDDGEQD
jgi:Holliday junction DNA helicase RuvB